MKKSFYYSKILLLSAIIAMLVSCNEEFIDLAPISSANVNAYFKKQADFESGIIPVYSAWRQLHGVTYTAWTEFRADTYTHTSYWYREISYNDFELNSTSMLCDPHYQIIARANIILDRIDEVENFDENVRNRIKAEARFLRAEAYFGLVRFFGAVPLTLKETSSKEALEMGRTPVSEIFKVIEDDYLFAIANLPSTIPADEYGRATSYAARGQLARVYITLSGKVYNVNRWADAKPLLENILFDSPHKFSETYEEVFAKDGSNEKGEEVIWSAIFKEGTGGQPSAYFEQFIGMHHSTAPFEPGLTESYEEGDIRKEVNIAPDYTTFEGVYFDAPTNIKFEYNFDITTKTHGADFPVLRYTDAYLLYAETLAEIAGNVPAQSLSILNEVRNRAGLASLTTADVPDIAAFRLALERERRSELMFECTRWFDLVRWGRAVEVLSALPGKQNVNETWLLYPIPQNEIDKVGKDLLPQNPGY
jgi:starch-binding outer membrane protein, SusD/RagB family